MKRQKFTIHQHGDTIVEVLIAIAIAAFAIGISYATAHRSLQQSITAREHNEALNELENQVADLKLRFQKMPASQFNTDFAVKNHFCLDDASSGPTDSAHPWAVYQNWNDTSFNENSPLVSSTGPDASHPYYFDSSSQRGCVHHRGGEGAFYYIDISTTTSTASNDPTLYQITVRWEHIGDGKTNQASLNYKLDGSSAQTLGQSTSGTFTPPSCGNLTQPITVTQVIPNFDMFWSSSGGSSLVFQWTPPAPLGAGCSYTMTVDTGDPCHTTPGCSLPQANEQLFIEFCTDATTCDTSNTATTKSPNPVYRTGDTVDIPDSVATQTTVFNIPPLSSAVNFLLFKHCSVDYFNNYPAELNACRLNGNSIHSIQVSY